MKQFRDRVAVVTGAASAVVRSLALALALALAARGARLIERFERSAVAPGRAAARILAAVERRSPRLLICRETSVIDALKRLAPVGSQRLVAAAMRRFGGQGS